MAAAWVARCRAALALAFALAAAPLRRRRPPPEAGAVAGEDEVTPEQAGAEGSSSTSSFAINLPPRGVVKVKDAHPPASLVCRRSFSSSPSIFCSESEQKKLAELQENTSFHFRGRVLNLKYQILVSNVLGGLASLRFCGGWRVTQIHQNHHIHQN